MSLEFKEKPGGLSSDSETDVLFNFLKTNPKYIKITFSILARRHSGDSNIKRRIENLPQIDDLEEDDKLNTYYIIMNTFYNTTREILDVRRGKLLELLVSKLKPKYTDGTYDIILEALVEFNGVEISNKDIDVVFKYLEIELIECKANLKSYLIPPGNLYREKKDKLDFMEDVKSLASQLSIKCHLFFATYYVDGEHCLDILRNNGYSYFEIVNSEIIEKSLLEELRD